MKLVDKEIDSWIEPYATVIGSGVTVDIGLKESDIAKYFLKLTQPEIFEAYAFSLTSFRFYESINHDKSTSNSIDLPEDEYKKIKWKVFFKSKDVDFRLNDAIAKAIDPKLSLNETYPGDGHMDKEQINSFTECILSLYGDQQIEIFYVFMSTWERKNLLYQGNISELPKLLNNPDLRLTPNLVYPKEKNWALNTDYDLPFTTIGGESRLIDLLAEKNKDEIYRIE